MALNPTKLSPNPDTVWGNLRVKFRDIDFDASYPTGGESLVASDFGLRRIYHVQVSNKNGYVFEYDYANSKLIARYADYDAVADGALIQVPDTTDLSAVTDVRVMAVGY